MPEVSSVLSPGSILVWLKVEEQAARSFSEGSTPWRGTPVLVLGWGWGWGAGTWGPDLTPANVTAAKRRIDLTLKVACLAFRFKIVSD